MSERADLPPWTGPWADDARRMFQLFQAALEQPDGGDADHEHPPECRYCPFCQGVALLRRAGPDVLDQLSDLAAGLAATLRAAQPPAGTEAEGPQAEGSQAGSAQGPETGPGTGGAAGSAQPPSTVRIDVTD